MKAKASVNSDQLHHSRTLKELARRHCPMQFLRQIEEVSVESLKIADKLLSKPEDLFLKIRDVLDSLESIAFRDDIHADLIRCVIRIVTTSVDWDAVLLSNPWIAKVYASSEQYPERLFSKVKTVDDALSLLHYSSSDSFKIQQALDEIERSDLAVCDKDIFFDQLVAICCKYRSWDSLIATPEWAECFVQLRDRQGVKKYAMELGFSEMFASHVKRKSQITAYIESIKHYDKDNTMMRVLTHFSYSPFCTETVASALLNGLPFYSLYYHLSEDEIAMYESIQLTSLGQDKSNTELLKSIRDYVSNYKWRMTTEDKATHLRRLKRVIKAKGFDATAYLAFAKKAFDKNLTLKQIDAVDPTSLLVQRKMLPANEICMRASEHHVTQKLTVQTYQRLVQYPGSSKVSSTSQAVCNAPLRLQSVASLLGYDHDDLQKVTDPDQLLWAVNAAHALHGTVGMLGLVSLHTTLQGYFPGVMRTFLKRSFYPNAFGQMCKDFLHFSPIHAEGYAMGVSVLYLLKMISQDALIKYNRFYSQAYMLRTIAKGESLKYCSFSSEDDHLSMNVQENSASDDDIGKLETGGSSRISSQSVGGSKGTLHLEPTYTLNGTSTELGYHTQLQGKKDSPGDATDSEAGQENDEPVDVLSSVSVNEGWIALKIAKILLYRSFTIDDHHKMQGYLNGQPYNYYLHDSFIFATALKVDPDEFKDLREKYHEDHPMISPTIGAKNIQVCNESDLNAVIMHTLFREYRYSSFVSSLLSQKGVSENKYVVDYLYTDFFNYLILISELNVLIHGGFGMPRYEMTDNIERNNIMTIWMDFAKVLMSEYERICSQYVDDDFQPLAAKLSGRVDYVFAPKEIRMQQYLERLSEIENQSASKSKLRIQEAVENLHYAILYASSRKTTLSDSQKTMLKKLFDQHDVVIAQEKNYNNACWQKKTLAGLNKKLSAVCELKPNALCLRKTGFFEGVKRMLYACDPIIDKQTTWREYLQIQADIVHGALGVKDSLSEFLTKFCIAMNARYYLDKNGYALYAIKACEKYTKSSIELLNEVERVIDNKLQLSRSSIFHEEKVWMALRAQVKTALPLD